TGAQDRAAGYSPRLPVRQSAGPLARGGSAPVSSAPGHDRACVAYSGSDAGRRRRAVLLCRPAVDASMTSREFQERLSRRAKKANVSLTAPVIDRLEAYYRLLALWNTKINLTALQLEELTDSAVDRLLLEP